MYKGGQKSCKKRKNRKIRFCSTGFLLRAKSTALRAWLYRSALAPGGAADARREGAKFFIQKAPIGDTFSGVLRNYLRYIEEPDCQDHNRRRWPTKPYWADLLGTARRISLYTKPGVEYNKMNLDAFVFQQAGNAIAAELIMMGDAAFCDKVRKDAQQLSVRYRSVIQQHAAMAALQEDQEGKRDT